MDIEKALELVARWDSFEMCSADEFNAVDALACEVRRLREVLAPVEGYAGQAGFIDGALARAEKLSKDNPGLDLCWGLESDSIGLAAEVRRLRAECRAWDDGWHRDRQDIRQLTADRDRLARELEELRNK